jgi:hypothetical protein
MQQQLLEKQDLKNPAPKQLLEKAVPKQRVNSLDNYLENNSDEEFIKYDSDNYSSNESESEEDDSKEDDCGSDIKNVTFNLNVINEIIEKIENRIKYNKIE